MNFPLSECRRRQVRAYLQKYFFEYAFNLRYHFAKTFLNLPFHKTFFYIGRFKSWKSFVWNALKRKSLLVVRHFCLEHARGAWRDLLLVTRPFPIELGIKLLSNFWRLELLFAVPATSSKFCLSKRPSIKRGTRNMPEHSGTSRNMKK